MLDRHLEPDCVEYRCECGECEACCGDWEFYDREADESDFDRANDEYLDQIQGCA